MTWKQGVNEKCLGLKDTETAILRNQSLKKRNLMGTRGEGFVKLILDVLHLKSQQDSKLERQSGTERY